MQIASRCSDDFDNGPLLDTPADGTVMDAISPIALASLRFEPMIKCVADMDGDGKSGNVSCDVPVCQAADFRWPAPTRPAPF
jgi:hypothetical protein